MPLQLVTPPAEEPVALAQAKLHLRVDFPDDDALIAASIVAARQAAETQTGRQFVTATWRSVLDAFPGAGPTEGARGGAFSLTPGAILLPRSPVQSVTAIDYLDGAGVWQTMPATDYTVDTAAEPARITPVFGQVWPVTRPQIGAVRVTFVAGYGGAAAVPEGVKSWILLRVGSLYNHREDVALLTRGSLQPMPFLDGLLDPFRVVTI
ncbi:head-tail connector protein [Accumulibacter sp.]|uniref:head-tail connector protein n=1 Tax=Accumulibacter sp. TaxID=2053492 RepID=UPI0025FEC685|nr:head-tail connector protein [Accumulibacter sp.]MCM8596648.1 head-tail connector protein [Accumulibacter sp.]MCM8625970.1 head-tail connector protein [Accumulibacter sp.]MDS4050796.1 head-tail connector protein [Accumulibacter sp.]